MSRKVWLITGAGRGIGAEIAKAVLAAGDQVVATGRNPESVEQALRGSSEQFLAVRLDVTKGEQAAGAIFATVERFGRIDVLVNNAGYGLFGALEECSAEEVEAQFRTNVFGLLAVTRAVLPVMRRQRSGHVINFSALSGFHGYPGASSYAASKFAVEGLSESLAAEVAPLGIHVTVVEPHYFRTEFFSGSSANRAAKKIADYEATSGVTISMGATASGKQTNDSKKLAQALLKIVRTEKPPFRLTLGIDAVEQLEKKLASMKQELDKWRDLSLSMAFDE